ncbi:MAG: hypothetical protein H6727_05755 [Myxococcales bacterium]|nr:hypothetical protein [Myxococcales bacterium]
MSSKNTQKNHYLGWFLALSGVLIAIVVVSSWFGRMIGQLQKEDPPQPVKVIAPEPREEKRDLSKLFPIKPPPRNASPQKSVEWENKMRDREEELIRRMKERQTRRTPPPPVREAFRVAAIKRSALKEWASLPLREMGARYAPNLRWGRPLGMRVTSLEDNSFLHKVGLREGDILLEVSGKKILSPGHAKEQYLHAAKRYRNLNLRYLRNGHTYMVDLSLRADQ